MPKSPNTHGGGARTNLNGLHFEQTTSLDDALYSAGTILLIILSIAAYSKSVCLFRKKDYIHISLTHEELIIMIITPKNGDLTKLLLISKTIQST